MPTDQPIANNNHDDAKRRPNHHDDTAHKIHTVLQNPPSPLDLQVEELDSNPALDPTTPTDIRLTDRQQRVLHYLARRRMRNPRITPRPTSTPIPEPMAEPEEVEPT